MSLFDTIAFRCEYPTQSFEYAFAFIAQGNCACGAAIRGIATTLTHGQVASLCEEMTALLKRFTRLWHTTFNGFLATSQPTWNSINGVGRELQLLQTITTTK